MFNYNDNSPDLINFNNNEVETLQFNGVTVWTKDTAPETWVLNDNLVSTIGEPEVFSGLKFTADGVFFTSLSIVASGAEKLLKYDEITPYSTASNTWASAGYKTLKFTEKPLGSVRNWLELNGTKQ